MRWLCGLVVALSLPALAAAAEEPSLEPQGRSVALLELRTAVGQVADLSTRLATVLRHNTSLQVLDPREARRRYGVRLDADVAACAGEASCIAAIGGRLKAQEVLLFAVSQLGDVVLALQRVDVAARKVAARTADSLPVASGATVVDEVRILGWLQQLYPPETFKRYGRIAIQADVAGAQVYLNTKPKGKTPLAEPVSVLAPGSYRLLVEKPKYLPFQAQLTVMPDTTVSVAARLVLEQLPLPWYKRWYVWAAVGAAAALAAGGTAVYYGAFAKGPPDMTRVPGEVIIGLRL